VYERKTLQETTYQNSLLNPRLSMTGREGSSGIPLLESPNRRTWIKKKPLGKVEVIRSTHNPIVLLGGEGNRHLPRLMEKEGGVDSNLGFYLGTGVIE